MAANINDDLDPKVLVEKPEALQGMSIEELNDYIVELQAAIERAREVIADKRKHLSGADALFKN